MYNQRTYIRGYNPVGYNTYPMVGVPYNPPNISSQSQSGLRMVQQSFPVENVQAIDGILIQNEYQPEKGEPLVIEQAVYKGQVIAVGDKKQEVIDENEAVLVEDGYASEDGKNWKLVLRITMNVFKLGRLQIKHITKAKAKFDSNLPQYKILKVVCSEKEYYLAFRQDRFREWFLRLVWAKLIIQKKEYPQFGNWESKVANKIYKKSKLMGDWQPRFVTIDARSLRASKDDTRNQVNLQIFSTKQIWTRFQQIRGGLYLVIKLWNGILKEQFAVPNVFCLKWLYHFLGLLSLK